MPGPRGLVEVDVGCVTFGLCGDKHGSADEFLRALVPFVRAAARFSAGRLNRRSRAYKVTRCTCSIGADPCDLPTVSQLGKPKTSPLTTDEGGSRCAGKAGRQRRSPSLRGGAVVLVNALGFLGGPGVGDE